MRTCVALSTSNHHVAVEPAWNDMSWPLPSMCRASSLISKISKYLFSTHESKSIVLVRRVNIS